VTLQRLRLFDFSPELVELFGRQTSVVVVVKPLDEVQSSVLGELELRLQDADCRLETDELLAATTTIITRAVPHSEPTAISSSKISRRETIRSRR